MYANLTDDELLRRLQATKVLSPLEVELKGRLQRALDEIDALTTAEATPLSGPVGLVNGRAVA